MWTCGHGEGRRTGQIKRVAWTYPLPYVTETASGELLSAQGPTWMLCEDLGGLGGSGGRGYVCTCS